MNKKNFFSIRKLSAGIASVAIGSLLLLATGQVANAADDSEQGNQETTTSTPAENSEANPTEEQTGSGEQSQTNPTEEQSDSNEQPQENETTPSDKDNTGAESGEQ